MMLFSRTGRREVKHSDSVGLRARLVIVILIIKIKCISNDSDLKNEDIKNKRKKNALSHEGKIQGDSDLLIST